MKQNITNNNIRIGNTSIPFEKHLFISLTYVHGIGKTLAKKILDKLNIPHNYTSKDLDLEQKKQLINEVERNYLIENSLKKTIEGNIKRLIRINCFRGTRHDKGLPIHGRTSSNARTHKKLRAKGKRFYYSLIN